MSSTPTADEQREAVEDVAEDIHELVHRWDGIGGPFGCMATLRNKKYKELQRIADKVIKDWTRDQMEQIGDEQ